MTTNTLLDATITEEDPIIKSLRPSLLDEFIGQKQAKNNLKVFIEADINIEFRIFTLI